MGPIPPALQGDSEPTSTGDPGMGPIKPTLKGDTEPTLAGTTEPGHIPSAL